MSIRKIKELSVKLKKQGVINRLGVSIGGDKIQPLVAELFDLIEAYKEPDPKVDTPPKVNIPTPTRTKRTRTTPKKEDTE